jgi:Matrixin
MWVKRSARSARLLAGALFCLAIATPWTAKAFEIKTTPSGAPVAWAPSIMTFETDPSLQDLADGAPAAISAAMMGWSGASGAPTFSVAPASTSSKPAVDGRNVIYFVPGGFPLAGSALAVTILTYDDTTGHILDADIVFNGMYSFAVLPEGSAPGADAPSVTNDGTDAVGGFSAATLGNFDVAHVVAHETGHALGMSDEMVSPTPLMFLYSQPGDASHRLPTSDDLRGIADLYAEVDGARGCASSTMSPKHPRPSTWVWGATLAAFALILARLGPLARRRSFASAGGLAFAAALVVTAYPRSPSAHGGDATAKVTAMRAVESEGPWQTEVSLSVVECRTQACPADTKVIVWGGHRGHVIQEIGDRVPEVGDEVLLAIPVDRATRILRPIP